MLFLFWILIFFKRKKKKEKRFQDLPSTWSDDHRAWVELTGLDRRLNFRLTWHQHIYTQKVYSIFVHIIIISLSLKTKNKNSAHLGGIIIAPSPPSVGVKRIYQHDISMPKVWKQDGTVHYNQRMRIVDKTGFRVHWPETATRATTNLPNNPSVGMSPASGSEQSLSVSC